MSLAPTAFAVKEPAGSGHGRGRQHHGCSSTALTPIPECRLKLNIAASDVERDDANSENVDEYVELAARAAR
jgi:hypothetical protein